MNPVALSFIFFLTGFLGVGIFAATRKKDTTEDYLLASRNVNPWLMALSAVATNNSGFMFVGLIGTTYTEGLSSVWLMVGWILGDYLAWLSGVPEKLRRRSAEIGATSIPSFLGKGLVGGRMVTVTGGLITLVFLGIYSAAQLTAGSKALHVLFGWNYAVGAVLGALIVVAYCFAGGIRASIWTDAVQSVVMIVAMVGLFALALGEAGGLSGMVAKLEAIDPNLVTTFPQNLPWGFGLFFLGWLAAGLGVVGQPHVMIRAMTLDDPDNADRARRIYIVWYVLFAVAAIGVGLASRVLLPPTGGFDAELAMPMLAEQLLPAVLVGFVLAGLFAATMSTADSQLLSCSAAITQDIFPQFADNYRAVKLATVGITLSMLGVALMGGSVFNLVVLAWSALASGLGPLLVVRVFGKDVSGNVGIAMMLMGVIAVLVWRYGFGFSGAVYDVLPGMTSGFLVYFISTKLQKQRPSQSMLNSVP
ncbi:MAG: sodium/proline symporter [Myxococcota bacterium]|nr:sodium/proline symporter [Myxococcota bacterium]